MGRGARRFSGREMIRLRATVSRIRLGEKAAERKESFFGGKAMSRLKP